MRTCTPPPETTGASTRLSSRRLSSAAKRASDRSSVLRAMRIFAIENTNEPGAARVSGAIEAGVGRLRRDRSVQVNSPCVSSRDRSQRLVRNFKYRRGELGGKSDQIKKRGQGMGSAMPCPVFRVRDFSRETRHSAVPTPCARCSSQRDASSSTSQSCDRDAGCGPERKPSRCAA
jgi:hypothetical protein